MDSYDEVQLDDEGYGLATISLRKPGKYFLTTYVDEQIGEIIYFEVVEGGKLAMLELEDVELDGVGMEVIAFSDVLNDLNSKELERMLAQNSLNLDEDLFLPYYWLQEMYEKESDYFKGLLAGTNYETGFNTKLLALHEEYVEGKKRVLTGYAEPGKKVVVAFRSATFASVVISDKETGYFEIPVPDDIENGDHVAYVYSVDDQEDSMSSVVRMLFRIYDSVEG